MSSSDFPDADGVAILPKWARVAFVARCAKRVLPLLSRHHDYPEMLPAIGAAERLVSAIEESAAAGRLDALQNLIGIEPFETSFRRAQEWISTRRNEESARFALACVMAANAAMQSLDVESILKTAKLAHEAPYNRMGVLELGAAQEFDFKLLIDASKVEGWDNETVVAPELFGPLWPDGIPERWPYIPSDRDNSENFELVLTLDIPEGMSDAEVLELVAGMATHADGVHRAYGGNGLMVDLGGIDIEHEVGVPVGGQS